MNKYILIFLITVVVVGGFLFVKNKNFFKNVPVNTEILGNKEDLISFSILPGSKVHGVMSYRGTVKGGYFFEANILIAEKKNSLLVPRQLVAFGNKVNVKGQKTPVIIKPGIVSSEFVEVLDGITTETILLPIKP